MQTDKTEGGFHGYLRSDQIAAPTGKLAEAFVLCWVYLAGAPSGAGPRCLNH